MSCIAGIVNLDGAPVDRELLERMTGAMKNRAPDASNVWISGNVGFGHAMLRTTPESENEHQPCSLDGKVWITADARIDGRDELIEKLRSAGRQVKSDVPDVELILHAYAAFGEKFQDHLIGDFAFALWDESNRKLICERDHFGVRPFFYVKTDRLFLFASTIDAILVCPQVSNILDEEAIGDFLLFCEFQNPELSIYRDIRRLRAASRITLDHKGFRVEKYWELSQNNAVRFKQDSEYVEQFQELFELAVKDRLRADRVATQLSGGMDCTSVAAVTRQAGCALTAYTTTCHDLIPDDQEGHFAELVASHLGIPVQYQEIGDYALFERSDRPELRTAEPISSPTLAAHYDNYAHIVDSGARVMLSGWGGDNVFDWSNESYLRLLRTGRMFRFLAETWRHFMATGTLSGLGLRSFLLGTANQKPWQPDFPNWVNLDFARRAGLEDRWEAAWRRMHGIVGGHQQLTAPWVSSMFEAYETLDMPLVVRHPFFDMRLVGYVLGLPSYMKIGKKTLRVAMRGMLPEQILSRPKTAMVGDQNRALFVKGQVGIQMESRLTHVENDYVSALQYKRDFDDYIAGAGTRSTWSSSFMISPIALNVWLAQRG